MSSRRKATAALRETTVRAASAARQVRHRRLVPAKPPLRAALWRYLAVLGPGLIVANAGNDAGGVFTYSNIGAKYGTALMWTIIPTAIALIVIQEMVARLGVVTGKGLMDLIRERFGVRWTLFAAVVVIIANGGTLLAEFAGAAGALSLLGVDRLPAVVGAAFLVSVVVLRGNRRLVERVLLALGLAFISYIITAFTVHPNWGAVGQSLLAPQGSGQSGVSTSSYLVDVIALVGTSITPYMQLFLQSSIVDKGTSVKDLNLVRADVISGSLFAQAVASFIIITTGATIFLHSVPGCGLMSPLSGVGLDPNSGTQQAACALAPLVGSYAKELFAVGLLGASLLAAAVLPLSTAFVVCEAFGAERSVQRSFREAPLFFTLFLGLIVIAAAIMLIPGVPVAGVAIGTQTLDGILLPCLLIFIILLANDRRLLGRYRNRLAYNVIAVLLTGVLIALTAGLLVTTLFPQLVG